MLQGKDGKTLTVKDAEFAAGVDDVVARLEKTKHVEEVKSPLAAGNEGQISEDGRSALVTFSIPGDENLDEKVVPSLGAVAAVQRAAPRPADRAVRRRLRRQGARRRARRRLQARGVPEPPDHDADPDRRLRRAGRRGCPAAARDHRRDRHARPRRPDQPDRSDGGIRELGDPPDRSRGRRRLLDVLPTPQDGGARRGKILRGRARVRRRDVGQGRARLRPHRADRDGRHVPGGQRRLHLLRRRHDARRRRRDARLGHRPARGAVQARRQRREGARPVHRPPAPPQPRRVARVGLGDRQGARPPGRLRDRRGRHPARARAPRRCT